MDKGNDIQNLPILHKNCIFEAREKSETHALVATELADHFLRWRGDRVAARMCKLDTERLALYSLRYGAGVDILPKAYEGFSLVHFSLEKSIDVTADQTRITVPTGRALVSSPRQNVRLSYEENSEQLIMRIPHALTDRLARKMGRNALHARFVQTPGLLLTEQASGFWQTQLQSFVALDRGYRENPALASWRTHFEESFAMFLLSQFGEINLPAETGADEAVDRRVWMDRLVQYVHENLTEPLTLAQMAQAAAVSERRLNNLCHEAFGKSPKVWLRDIRLDRARASLMANPVQSLSNLAMEMGFFHLGRFSTYYHQRFDELPSQTRRRAKNG